MYYWDDGTETTQDNPVYVWTNYYEAIAAANMALEAIEKQDFDSVFALARKYFACERSENPLIEIAADGQNTVLRRISY